MSRGSSWRFRSRSRTSVPPVIGQGIPYLAADVGLIGEAELELYESLPRDLKDAFVEALIDLLIAPYGYDPLGLDGSNIDATLLEGGYTAVHVFGWSEFEIDADTQVLTITTWGIDPYGPDDLADDPAGIAARVPEVVSRFRVVPH